MLRNVSMADKYALDQPAVFASGPQVLVRLLLAQAERDRRAGLRTGGFVSGYRGSPVGGVDRALWAAHAQLEANNIRFWPGVNEDLAATAVWGSQQVQLDPMAKVQGVFGMWYGKGAGLDRSGDAIRHANGAGVSPFGGVLAVVGDDHAQKSSTNPYASDRLLSDLLIPVLAPTDLSDVMRLGLIGWGMSRYSGAWAALKVLPDHMDASGVLRGDPLALDLVSPGGLAPSGVHLRWPDVWTDAEVRAVTQKIDAAMTFARANRVNQFDTDLEGAVLGVMASGKAYLDLREALQILGLDLATAEHMGVRIYRVGMTWPLDPADVQRLARGLQRLVIVEEKRAFLEEQVKALLYDMPDRPAVSGKRDASGGWQFPWIGELTPEVVALAIARHLSALGRGGDILKAHARALEARLGALAAPAPVARKPYFCSGCPHNRSTLVPEGSRALVGVGCHFMASALDRETSLLTQMGGEGTNWIGQAPFTGTEHVFVNLGEGTYYHSGSLALRAAVAAGVNATYKILFNDAVAMTGGQPVDGPLTVSAVVRQVLAEGAREVAVVSETPERFKTAGRLPSGVTVSPRTELDAVQRRLREMPGVTVLVYDQTCAAEKRRLRKRNALPAPTARPFINHLVCEACGDCSRASNCLSVTPRETEFGRKRQIDQSSCNQDFSCVEGFCPSFVTVEGAPRRPPLPTTPAVLPEPSAKASPDSVTNVLLAGVGGMGVTTVAALLGMAAHLEGREARVLDMTGMAQKGGAVISHVRLGPATAEIHAPRAPGESLDLLLGFDIVVAAQADVLNRTKTGRTYAIVNTHETLVGAGPADLASPLPILDLRARIAGAVGSSSAEFLDGAALVLEMFGDTLALNLFFLGIAYQQGRLPLSAKAIERAVQLNGAAVPLNLAAFGAGRAYAVEAEGDPAGLPATESPAELVTRLGRELTAYHSERYAQRYAAAIRDVETAEIRVVGGAGELTQGAAEGLFRLMAYKDEYEVARLFTDGRFGADLRRAFGDRAKIRYHMAPPLFAPRGADGLPRKIALPAALTPVLRLLAGLRRLRGTPFDPFGHTAERRQERALIERYLRGLAQLSRELNRGTYAQWLAWAELAQTVRGYGHIKKPTMEAFLCAEAELRQAIGAGESEALVRRSPALV